MDPPLGSHFLNFMGKNLKLSPAGLHVKLCLRCSPWTPSFHKSCIRPCYYWVHHLWVPPQRTVTVTTFTTICNCIQSFDLFYYACYNHKYYLPNIATTNMTTTTTTTVKLLLQLLLQLLPLQPTTVRTTTSFIQLASINND